MYCPALATLLALLTFILVILASPLQMRSTQTTTCLNSAFGGCCIVDSYGAYGSCINATLVAENVFWTGIPTTLTANQWACASPVNGNVVSAGCCGWSWNTVDVTYPNGVTLPTLQKSMACTASSVGISRKREMEEDGVMRRGWGGAWW
ncbi:hypothetical protein EYC80_010905 [Monilinia laxa]|uniref:Hydrophobin n=1 Tax=Monilinia laxa TaxID=61186 RepID=A0A5N6JQ60_MONLA|nr:hypothetical protein EYC80_010905 [Monilinia laxa]